MINTDDFYKLIESRKSIRKFKNTEPPKEVIERILQSALHAPSGKNRQNWRFFIVRGEKRDQYLKYSQKSWLGIKDILKQRLKPSLYEFTERFFYTLGDAPIIVFAYNYNSTDEKYLTNVGSVYMAVQNINLACVAEGLGCCTMGAPLEIKKEVDDFLGLKNLKEYQEGNLELLCGIAMGYPDHNPPKAPREISGRINWVEK
jgi:nitroreductase